MPPRLLLSMVDTPYRSLLLQLILMISFICTMSIRTTPSPSVATTISQGALTAQMTHRNLTVVIPALLWMMNRRVLLMTVNKEVRESKARASAASGRALDHQARTEDDSANTTSLPEYRNTLEFITCMVTLRRHGYTASLLSPNCVSSVRVAI